MTTNNRISNLVNSQVPFFVRNEHQNFVTFLEKYYEYLEQSEKVVERIKSIKTFRDIDLTEDIFADKLYEQFLKLLPKDVIADKALILKHIKDFYRAKGTENATSFLIRILLNADTEFYYPKLDILRASDGNWFVEKSLKIKDFKVNNASSDSLIELNKFSSKKITGNTSNASAIVETVDVFYEKGILIYELKLSNQNKSFLLDEEIFTYFEDEGVVKTLTANTFGGIISTVELEYGGTGYTAGTYVPIESETGTGASILISSVTTGNLKGIAVTQSGAGFQNGNFILITGGGGSGANANSVVSADGFYHPNSYNIVSSTISLEANTPLNNTIYSNLNSSNVNTSISDAVNYFVYGDTGPITRTIIINPGDNYTSDPTLDVLANTRVRALGILGRLEIVDGGSNYSVSDKIEFINVTGGYGTGAAANVTNVDESGAITEVKFEEVPGHIIGGSGYTNQKLPIANVVSSTGNGANIIVKTVLGDGEELISISDTIGTITKLTLTSSGTGYTTPPTLNLKSLGDGTALANATVISGVFEYPGRFTNDNGQVSSYNFLEDRDYYQNFSYVIRTNQYIENYRKAVKDLTHPSGSKLFGEFLFKDESFGSCTDISIRTNDPIISKFYSASYYSNGNANGSNISINLNDHLYSDEQTVYLEFISGSNRNLESISIEDGGIGYSNGYINFTQGSGTNANAYIRTNTDGSIISVNIVDDGAGYLDSDNLFANVDHLLTYNISSISIDTPGQGYSNGKISFTGGTGRNANIEISVDNDGAIVDIVYNNRGTGYSNGDNVVANVSSLLSYNIANIPINAAGDGYSNGYIIFEGGSGRNANANIVVNSTGSIINVYINSSGVGYYPVDINTLKANVSHLTTYRIDKIQLLQKGVNYSNGYISIEGGSGSGANANITVDINTGQISYINVNSVGSGYSNGDNVVANVQHLLTYNIANIDLISSGYDYSNGYISIEGGSGVSANANVTVDSNGTISNIYILNSGTGYSESDVLYANVEHLLTYNISSISIDSNGHTFSNGYVTFEGGSGRNANANVSVNSTGAIVSVNIINNGTGYLESDAVIAKITQLTTFNVNSISIISSGSGYSNGYVTFEGGSGSNANANVSVNSTGAIVSVTVNENGFGYYYTDEIVANVSHLGGADANLSINLQLGDPYSANLSVSLQKGANTANIPVVLQKGSGNSIIRVLLAQSGNVANLYPITLQKNVGQANLSVSLQKGANTANLIRVLRAEPLNLENTITTIANTTNTNWFYVNYSDTANSFGNVLVGTVI